MSPPRRSPEDAIDALIAVAPLVGRWMDRLLAGHTPPVTVTQFLALRAISHEDVSGSELARRAGVSGAAVSQLLNQLARAELIGRGEQERDRRRQTLTLTAHGHGRSIPLSRSSTSASRAFSPDSRVRRPMPSPGCYRGWRPPSPAPSRHRGARRRGSGIHPRHTHPITDADV